MRNKEKENKMQNKKWRVLIVDDEFRIGMLIKKLIHWNEVNMECIDTVDHCEKALEIVKNDQVDVIITDIRMPKISGLDMIGMVKKLKKDIKFVVVSGYKEFEYAHKALQYGVEDYLLKPINEKQINEILGKISANISKNYNQSVETIEMQKTISESRHIIKRDFLKNIIDQEDRFDINDGKVRLEGEMYIGICMKLDYVDYNVYDFKQDKLTVEKIISMVDEILKPEVNEVLLCEKENLHIYGLFNYDCIKSKEIRNKINEILSETNKYLMGFEQYEVTIGVGTERTDFSDIRFTIKESNKAVCARIKLGTGRLIYADSIMVSNTQEELRRIIEKNKEKLFHSMSTYSRKKLENTIDEIYDAILLTPNIDFSFCYDLADELLTIFFDKTEIQLDKISLMVKNIRLKCQHCYSIDLLKNVLKTCLGEIIDETKEAMEAKSSKPIREAQKYIEEHYWEKIVLEDFAEIVGLNPVYFSVLFKKEMGINFSAYLTKVRIEKAKELLCNTNETIVAIADLVGYKDSRYFSQAFTKIVGVKPALYRKLHS